MVNFIHGNRFLGPPHIRKGDSVFKTLKHIYKGLSPYIVPALLVITMVFYFNPPEVIEVPVIQTVTETVTLPVEIREVPFAVTDTLYMTNTELDTVYLPGDTIYVKSASADTTLTFGQDQGDIHIDVAVDVAATYFYPPYNYMELSGSLQNIDIYLPKDMTRKTFYMVGSYVNGRNVGLSVGLLHNKQIFNVGYGVGGPMASYSMVF